MKSKTSFFNKTVFWKDVTRFAPVWALYTLLITWNLFSADKKTVYILALSWESHGLTALLYGLICGAVLYGDLFKTRLCNGLHAMPLRRECWFVTHFLAGLAFCVLPELLKTTIMVLKFHEMFALLLMSLGATLVTFLFYFGVAALCAQFTGKRFAMVLVYGLICFLPALVNGIVEGLYVSLLPNVVLNWENEYLMPAVYLAVYNLDMSSIDLRLDILQKPMESIKIPSFAELGITTEFCIYLAAVAVIGLIFAALALVMYRRRKLESAGDFITRPYMGVAFLILYTLLATLILGHTLGFVVGFFTGLMLLRRTVRVFNKRNLAIFAVSAALFAASIGLTAWDPFGISCWIPEPENVKSVCVNYDKNKITDPETIETAVRLHELSCEQQKNGDYSELEHFINMDYTMTLTYELKSGRTVSRMVYLEEGKDLIEVLTLKNKLQSSCGYLTGYESWESLADAAVRGSIEKQSGETRIVKEEDVQALIQALQKDSEAGRGLGANLYDAGKEAYVYRLVIRTQDKEEHTFFVFADSTYTITWIQENVYN